jgi:membrane protein YqaA with SNARE-associated domain
LRAVRNAICAFFSPHSKVAMPRSGQVLNVLLIVFAWGILFYLAQADVFTARYYGLPALFVLVASASCFFPVPVNVLVLLAAESAKPGAVVAVAACATFPSYLLEYEIYRFIIRRGSALDIKQLKIAPKLFEGFMKYPFAVLAITSFLPMPSEPIRLYAISTRHNRVRFALAGTIGRALRFGILVWIGALVGTPPWLFVAVIVLPVLFAGAGYLYKRAVVSNEF